MKNKIETIEGHAGVGPVLENAPYAGVEKNTVTRGLRSQNGVVLVAVLILSAVVLAVMTSMIYMMTAGTQISGLQKRYKTSLEAAKGGSDLFYEVVATRGDLSTLTSANPVIVSQPGCQGLDIYTGQTITSGFQAKLKTPSDQWTAACKANNITIDPADSTTYDLSMTIGTAPQPVYNYYAKLSGALEGNSASLNGSELYSGSVITSLSGGGSIPVVSKPYMYAIEVYAVNASNSAERAKLSILYQY